VVEALRDRVPRAVSSSRFPVVYGGDCSSLLGTISGLGDSSHRPGLLFIDGHEDTMPLDVSEDGEAANAEIGLLLGLTGGLVTGPLTRTRQTLDPGALAMLGQRDEPWRRKFNVGSLRDRDVWLRSVDEVATDPANVAARAVEHVTRRADRWWLHVDLDVLDPLEFAAQGLPDVEDEPGGLTWRQLTDLLVSAVRGGGCAGWSLVIYDPEQDPEREDAQRIVRLVKDVASAMT